jgi:4-azaleucine resistance transporter AzlC
VPPTADGSARPDAGSGPAPDRELAVARRRLLLDALAIGLTAAGFGLVYGLSARNAGLSPLEAIAMSTIVFAGAAQFAALGYLVAGVPWPAIALLTLFLNARHLLYSASLAPRLRHRPAAERAVAAHLLTDEAFALGTAHFARLGRIDMPGYWIGAIVATFIPWNLATIAGNLLGGAIPDPTRFGLDVVFPAAMLGLAAGLVTGRRELVAAGAGAAIAVAASLAVGTGPGIIAGGLVVPLLAMTVPEGRSSSTTRARDAS